MTRNKFTDVLHENAPKYLPKGVTLAELISEPYTPGKVRHLAELTIKGGYCYTPELLCDCFGLPYNVRCMIARYRRQFMHQPKTNAA